MQEDEVPKGGDGDEVTRWTFASLVGNIPIIISIIMQTTAKYSNSKELISNVHKDLVPLGEFGLIQRATLYRYV